MKNKRNRQKGADEPEYRMLQLTELRVEGNAEEPKIVGYAAVFDQWSEDLGGFREIIRAGAFTKTLKDGADVRALFNHDPNFVLGRSKSGTLDVSEDKKGLAIKIDPPTTQLIRDLVIAPIQRGDINQMSFAFRTVKDSWQRPDPANGRPLAERELLEVKLYDVSPVTYPAYPQTSVAVRELVDSMNENAEEPSNEPRQEPHSEELAKREERLFAAQIDI